MSLFNLAFKALQGGVQAAAMKKMQTARPHQKESKCTPCAASAYVQQVKAQTNFRKNP